MSLLAIVTLAYCILYKNLKIHKLHLLIPLFTVFALIGTIIYSHQFRSWFTLVLLTISFFIFYYSFRIIGNKYVVICLIALAFFVFSIYYIIHYGPKILDYKSYTNSDFRLGFDFDNPNAVGTYAAIGISMSLYLVLFWNKKIRFTFIVPAFSSLIVGLTTGSRSFLLIVLFVVLVFLYFKFQKHKLIYLIVVLTTIGLFIILLFLPFMSTLRERLLQAIGTIFGTGAKADTSTIERVLWMDYGFYLGAKNILFGYGSRGFAIYSGVGTYTHSNFSEVFCDFGLIGLVLFYSPLFVLLVKSILNKKIEKSFVITFFMYYIIMSFTTVYYYKKIYYLILSFMFYLVFADEALLVKNSIVTNLKKVVFICDHMGSGGAEKVIATISNEMAKRGIGVSIIGVADFDEPNSFYRLNDGVLYKTLFSKGGKRINSFKRIFVLRKAIACEKPDVVISFLPNANIYTWLSLIGTKIPHIVSERNNPYLDPKRKVVRLFKKLSFHYSYGSVFQTENAMNFYSETIRNRSVIIKNPLDGSMNNIAVVAHRNKSVLTVGRLIEQKNQLNLLKAFKLFNSIMNNEYCLKIYGDGPLKDKLIDYCKRENILKYVQFMGNDSNWQINELNDSMFVLSSNYEGMPNALMEAMSVGIPSISTDCPVGGPRELIVNGENGYLVPVNNPIALADVMVLVAKENPNYSEYAKKMQEEYSPKTIVDKWINFVESIKEEVYE